jgi:gamma-glutamylputrescine oxidase
VTASGAGVTAGPVWGTRQPLPPPPPLPARAEIVVIGGGITGTALLAALRLRGVDAVLLERDHLAAGASGRNAGFLLAGVAENYAYAVTRYGRDVAREVWGFTLANHELVATAAARFDAGYRRRGSLVVAVDSDEAASLEEAATLLSEDGLPGALTTQGVPPEGVSALLNEADGEIDPVRLVRGLAFPLADRVFEGHEVIAVEDGESGVSVQLEGHTVEAQAVVLATNAWTAQLHPGIPITPVRAQMLATAPDTAVLSRPVYAEWGQRYWRQRNDGAVLAGGFRNRAPGDEVGYDVMATDVVQRHLDAQLRRLRVGAPVTHRWAGTMGFTEDGLPLVGLAPIARHVFVCGGYTGHGMGFAVNAAAALVGHMLDSQRLPSWLDIARISAR